jgi:hypothetical protein
MNSCTCSRANECPIEDKGLMCMAYYKVSRVRTIMEIRINEEDGTCEINYPSQDEPCSRILDITKLK